MTRLRYGPFDVDLLSSELYKQGRLIRLQHQPFEVLRILLEHPDQLVTREMLRQRLWPEGVTVDFDQSLNKSITKLREALGDTATSSRFIETIPKRGYRLIGVVHASEPAVAPAPAQAAGRATSSSPQWLAAALVVAVAVPALIAVMMPKPRGVEARAAEVTPRRAATSSPIHAARDAYERGRLALARRTQESLKLSVDHFERALALSPRYADAYVGLADSWSLMASYGLVDPRDGMPRARDAANRALTLDPSIARAHASLGRTAMIFDWDWPSAEDHFTRAIALDSGHATTHQWFAYFLSASGRHPDAIDAAERAVASEPLSLNTNTALGYVLYAARRYDDAALHLERTLEIDPDFAQARRNLALVRLQQGRPADALAAMKRVAALNDSSPVAIAELAWMHAINRQISEARGLLAKLDRLRTTSYVPPDSMALIHMALGSPDEAIGWLQRAVTMRVASVAHLPVDPMWDALRHDQRLNAMIRAIRP